MKFYVKSSLVFTFLVFTNSLFMGSLLSALKEENLITFLIETKIHNFNEFQQFFETSSTSSTIQDAFNHPDLKLGIVAVNHDGSIIAATSGDFNPKDIFIFNTHDANHPTILHLPNGENIVLALAFPKIPGTLMTLTYKASDFFADPTEENVGVLRLWDISTGKITKETRTSDFIHGPLTVSFAGDFLAYTIHDHEKDNAHAVRIVSTDTFKSAGYIEWPDKHPASLTFSSTAKKLLMVGENNIAIYSIQENKMQQQMKINKEGREAQWQYWLSDDKLHLLRCILNDDGVFCVLTMSLPLSKKLSEELNETQKSVCPAMSLKSPIILAPNETNCIVGAVSADIKHEKADVAVFQANNQVYTLTGLGFSGDSKKCLYSLGPYFVLVDIESNKPELIWQCKMLSKKPIILPWDLMGAEKGDIENAGQKR
jgi:hypothetical protein